ncbi:MAG: DUF2116 family Zn-ribbon domain-containing protein [Candidatus Diapherotrites archaeon]|nr:DUF2116 family Zn-ribbon domain-containing protein [Candidatus Diapherotrites archaeon]
MFVNLREKKGVDKVKRCMNCGREIPGDQVNDMYSARFCSEKCKEEYMRG